MDECLLQIDKLRRALDKFNVGAFSSEFATSEQDYNALSSTIKLLTSKRLTYLALRRCQQERGSKSSSEELTYDVKFNEEIFKLTAIEKAKLTGCISTCILNCVSNESADNSMKNKMMEKMRILLKQQREILELTEREKQIQSDIRRESIAFQADLQKFKEALLREKNMNEEAPLSVKEQKVLMQIEKINVIRKLMMKIMLTKEFNCTDEWNDLFQSLRDRVTVDSFKSD